MIDDTAIIHRLAHVENASVGARSLVWQFASVIRGAVIGADCKVASCAIVDGSKIGDRSIVSHGAFLDPGMEIGEDVFIGPHVVFCNDFWPRVSKADFDMAPMISGEMVITRVMKGASVGAGVIVLPGLTIGAGAMIAAGAVVTCDVPPEWLYGRDGGMAPIDKSRPIRRVRAAAHRGVPVAAE